MSTWTLGWMLGGWELAVLAGLFGLLFFGKRLPEAARGLGQSFKEFRKGLSEVESQVDLPRVELPRPGDLLPTPGDLLRESPKQAEATR